MLGWTVECLFLVPSTRSKIHYKNEFSYIYFSLPAHAIAPRLFSSPSSLILFSRFHSIHRRTFQWFVFSPPIVDPDSTPIIERKPFSPFWLCVRTFYHVSPTESNTTLFTVFRCGLRTWPRFHQRKFVFARSKIFPTCVILRDPITITHQRPHPPLHHTTICYLSDLLKADSIYPILPFSLTCFFFLVCNEISCHFTYIFPKS